MSGLVGVHSSTMRITWTLLPLLLVLNAWAQEKSEPANDVNIEDKVPPAWAADNPKSEGDLIAIQEAFLDILPEARKAIVCVKLGGGSGSGVIVSKDGLVLTAGHVSMAPGQELELVLTDGRTLKAETLGRSDFADSGLIRITDDDKENLPHAPMAPSDKAKVGEWVFSVGHPGGYDKARGTVVRLGRIISKRSARMRTDCKIVMGDSGGALFNMDGEVIGIHSRISKNVEDNYHCPIEAYYADWDALMGGDVVSRQGGYLGAAVRKEASGLIIRLIVENSAAEKAGLQEGDVILEVNEETCLDEDEWKTRIGVHEIGESITLKILRDEEEKEFDIKLTKRPRR